MIYIKVKEKNMKGANMTKINKDMIISDILEIDMIGLAPILMDNGLHCIALSCFIKRVVRRGVPSTWYSVG